MRQVVFLVATLVVAVTARAERFSVSTGVFGITCTSSGQLCEPPATLQVGDPEHVVRVKKVVYEASAAHCSAGRLHVALDGKEVGRMRFVIGRERSTLKRRLRLAPGFHIFAFQFEGRTGGCNAGAVSGWGGAVTVFARRAGKP